MICKRLLFEVQQELFAAQASAIAAQVAVLLDDAMAGNEYRNPVHAVRPADGPHGLRCADVLSEIAIGSRLAIRHLQEFLPNALLKWSAGKDKRHREGSQRPREVLSKLGFESGEMVVLTHERRSAEAFADRLEL